MIDSFIVPGWVHNMWGLVVLVSIAAALAVSVFAVYKRQELSRTASLVIIIAQLAVMVQVLIGIKLLDQGAGVLQLYIHYVGGTAPLFFFILGYWIPFRDRIIHSRAVAGLSAAAFVFAIMTFAIGQAYVSRGVA